MAIEALTKLRDFTFSSFEKPNDHVAIRNNLVRISLKGALGSGIVALTFSKFSSYLAQEEFLKPVASHLFKPYLSGCLTFSTVLAYCFYKVLTTDTSDFFDNKVAETFNQRVSLFAKGSTLVGFVGAAAGLACKFVTSNTQVSSLAKHSFYLIGLGAAGSLLLWPFHHSQNKLLSRSYSDPGLV
jgi:hypothetical protein